MRSPLKPLALLALLLVPGCYAQPAVVMPDDLASDREAAFEHHRELQEEEDEALQLVSSDACEDACAAGERVCDLSERICDIAERHPGDEELSDRCDEGRASCERVRGRLEVCGCGPE